MSHETGPKQDHLDVALSWLKKVDKNNIELIYDFIDQFYGEWGYLENFIQPDYSNANIVKNVLERLEIVKSKITVILFAELNVITAQEIDIYIRSKNYDFLWMIIRNKDKENSVTAPCVILSSGELEALSSWFGKISGPWSFQPKISRWLIRKLLGSVGVKSKK